MHRQLYVRPEDPSAVLPAIRINTYAQLDGWSCGYRAVAYAWHMVNGASLPELADLQFDLDELPKWMLSCLENKHITAPPTVKAGPNDKRVADIKLLGKHWEVNVMVKKVMKA